MIFEVLNNPALGRRVPLIKGTYTEDTIQKILESTNSAGRIPDRIMEVLKILDRDGWIAPTKVIEVDPGQDMGDGCLYPSVRFLMHFLEMESSIKMARVIITASRIEVFDLNLITLTLDLRVLPEDLEDEVCYFFEQVKSIWGTPQVYHEQV